MGSFVEVGLIAAQASMLHGFFSLMMKDCHCSFSQAMDKMTRDNIKFDNYPVLKEMKINCDKVVAKNQRGQMVRFISKNTTLKVTSKGKLQVHETTIGEEHNAAVRTTSV